MQRNLKTIYIGWPYFPHLTVWAKLQFKWLSSSDYSSCPFPLSKPIQFQQNYIVKLALQFKLQFCFPIFYFLHKFVWSKKVNSFSQLCFSCVQSTCRRIWSGDQLISSYGILLKSNKKLFPLWKIKNRPWQWIRCSNALFESVWSVYKEK